MTTPPPRAIGQLKSAPCGPTTDVRGSQAVCFEPGAKVKIGWIETIDHPGHYRIMFDDDGTDAFVDPSAFDDTCSPSSTCLVDGIADKSGGSYEQEITLPMQECETCTLQLVQVMTDKAPYGDGNDLYYQCADIVIRAGGCGGSTTSAAAQTAGSGPAAGGTTGGGTDGGAGGAGSDDTGGGCTIAAVPATLGHPAFVVLSGALLGLSRRRRRRRRSAAPVSQQRN